MKTVWASHTRNTLLHDKFCEFAALRIWGAVRPFPMATTMAVVEGKTVRAVMVFYDYDKDAGVIQISGAADTPRWLTRAVLHEMFSFPFDGLGCQAVVMRVDPDDTRLRRILTAYGFESVTLRRMRGRHKNECIYTLFDDVWRTNGFHRRPDHGKESA